MNLYETLGISENATQEEIKKAYRKLAAQHHPDKGGDTATFQTINQAYDILGNEQKRYQYDAQMKGMSGANNFYFNSGDINDIFNQMFGGNPFHSGSFRQARPRYAQRKNKDLNIRLKISLKQSYTGAELEASYQTPSGKNKNVIIRVPKGIQSGQTIRYQGFGDDTDPNLPIGDLNVTVIVENELNYERRNDDLLVYLKINPIEAMIGCTKTLENLDGSQLHISIRPGVQHGTEYVTKGLGFKNLKGGQGNLITVIGIEIPAIIDPKVKEKLEEIYAEISIKK